MWSSKLAQRSAELQNKARALRLLATCACLRLPLIKNVLWTFVEELWARAISISELVPIHSIPDGHLWIGEICSAQANIYSREWFYFNLFTGKTSGRFFDKLWSCKCRTCTLLSILLKSLLLKNDRRLAWVQMSVIMRFGLQNKFLQFASLLVIASAKNLETLKPRCIHIKRSFILLNRALSALEALRQTKLEIIELNQRLVQKLISIYVRPPVALPSLYLAGKRGLIKAINRFDFDYPVQFASYARLWVKHELLKQFALPKRTPLPSQLITTYTFGDIGLWDLIELATGTTTPPPKVPLANFQTRIKNAQEVYSGLFLLTPRERRMLMLRCCRPKWTFLAIGNEYNLSKERVRQLCNRSIKRMKSICPPLLTVNQSIFNLVLFHINESKPSRRFVLQSEQTFSTLSSPFSLLLQSPPSQVPQNLSSNHQRSISTSLISLPNFFQESEASLVQSSCTAGNNTSDSFKL
ncbi:MAG: sigma factor-like helix-turn-helix DNA-binding protein [Candidatus Hodgkinia cicadicola]